MVSAEEARPLTAVIHVHTGISDGTWTPKHVAEEAKRLGVDVVLLGDSLLERWEFGLPPLRHVMRRVVEQPSVLTWGAASYFEHIRALAREVPEVLLIPGVSVAPFYRWSDIPILRGGVLEEWHRQLLVFGLDDPRVLTDIPAVSNAYASWTTAFRHPRKLWPVLLVVLGGWGWWHARHAARGRWSAGLLMVLGLALLWNADLRATSTFTPYQPDPGARPYQQVIDDVTQHGGLVLWSHPALASSATFHGIPVMTAPYLGLLFQTKGYTGFGMNYVGYFQFLEPAQGWDQLLLGYCRGTRQLPPWLVGEVGFHQPTRSLTMVETIIYATDRSTPAVLEAIRHGRMAAQFNLGDGADVVLTRYRVIDDTSAQSAGMGDTLQATGPIRLELEGRRRADSDTPTTITIIRNGQLAHEARLETTPFALQWRDDAPPAEAHGYYRVILQRGGSYVFTNPTFVKRHVP